MSNYTAVDRANEDAPERGVGELMAAPGLKPLVRMALLHGELSLVTNYLDRGGDIDAVDQRGRSPLMIAASRGDANLCLLLLRRGAATALSDCDGCSAIDIAISSGYPHIGNQISEFENVYVESPVAPGDDNEESLLSWDVEEQVTQPVEDDSAIRVRQACVDGRISIHKIIDLDPDLVGFELDLPSSVDQGLMARQFGRPALDMLQVALTTGAAQGFTHLAAVEEIAREMFGEVTDESFQRIQRLFTDLAYVVESNDWCFGHLVDDASVPELDIDVEDFLTASNSFTNAPEHHIERQVVSSSILSREDEVGIGREIKRLRKNASSAVAHSTSALALLLEFREALSRDPRQASSISRLDEQGAIEPTAEDGENEIVRLSRDDGGLLGRLDRIDEYLRTPSAGQSASIIIESVNALEMTTLGFQRIIQGMESGECPELASSVTSLVKLDRMMITSNVKLAAHLARKYQWSSIPLADLYQEAFVGLMRAVAKFDYEREIKFSTYATWWIKQSLVRCVGDKERIMRVPIHMIDRMQKIRLALRKDEERNGLRTVEPSLFEVAEMTGLTPVDVERASRVPADCVYWDESDELRNEVHRVVDHGDDPVDVACEIDFKRFVGLRLGHLKPREKFVLERRFGIVDGREMTLEEVGKALDVTRERVRQIEAAALRRLRRPELEAEFRVFL